MADEHQSDPMLDIAPVQPNAPRFTCPVCGAISHNPNDAREGYCGRCHAWTGTAARPNRLYMLAGLGIACTLILWWLFLTSLAWFRWWFP